ncbi:MAG: hypothetical protein ABH822_01875 [Patescibacteria group bacterium]
MQRWMMKLLKLVGKRSDRSPETIGAELLFAISESVYEIFDGDEFRKLVDFDSQNMDEQSRIFYELELAALCLLRFGVEAAEDIAKPKNLPLWSKISEKLPELYERKLIDFGVDKKNVRKVYRKVVEARYNEYRETQQEVRSIWTMDDPQYHKMPESLQDATSRVHAIVIGTADYIRRGKMKPNDPLAKLLIEWLLPLNEQIGKWIIKI